jgi:hypothetical protein
MKMKSLMIGHAVNLFVVLSVQGQGTFQNLNFEQADPISAGDGYPSYIVTAASALPYWTVSIGGVQQSLVLYNVLSAGAPAVELIGPGAEFGLAPIDGTYSAVLTGSGVPSAASISQTGLIPAGTESLLFEAEPLQSGTPGPLEVQVGSQVVPFFAVGTGPNYTLYGANISTWADAPEQLTFSALEDGLNTWELDDISFSTTAVTPEPSIVALTAIGGVLCGARRWFARR